MPERVAGPIAGRHMKALDGVRGFAVLLVIAFHSRWIFLTTAEIPLPLFRFLGMGWSGVDLFFVLSGFLITGILLDTRTSPSYFRTFYLRRVLRIFPLYYCYLFVILVAVRIAVVASTGANPWASTNPWWFITYLMNWKADHAIGDRYLGHLWSLAIEEQFYLVWPAVVWFCPRNRLKWVCLAVIAAAPLSRALACSSGCDTEALYRITTSRLDSMGLGAFVALGVRDFEDRLRWLAGRAFAVCGAGFVSIGMLSTGNVWTDLPMRTIGATMGGVAYSCLVFWAATNRDGRLVRFFSGRFLRTCGKHSYAMYIVHAPLCLLLITALPPGLGAFKYLFFPLLAAGSLGIAKITWVVIEQPFLRLKDRFAYAGTPATKRAAEIISLRSSPAYRGR